MAGNRILKERGVAILLVLGAISMLTIAIVEFATSTDIQIELAMNERDRLRAEYLALSAANLMQLELQLEKTAKGLLANAPAAMTEGLGGGPLCQKFPMSSSLLRGLFLGDSGDKKPSSGPTINMFQQQAAQEFLDFVGDFDGQCADLQSRVNLNQFFDLDPAQQAIASVNAYDQAKLTLTALFQQEAYKEVMATLSAEDIKNAARNLADWVDKNDQINELGGVVAGPEAGLYPSDSSGVQNRVKNGKMLSMAEAFLVKGVGDDWFNSFREMLTVYGDSKINVCQADPAVSMALITRYAAGTQRFATVDTAKPEMKEKLMAVVLADCKAAQPQPTKIAQDVDTILGGGAVAPAAGAAPATPAPKTETKPAEAQPQTGPATASNFSQMITTEARWYELKSTGQVGDVIVHLTQVWDTKNSDPKQWKLVFSKLE